MADHIIRIPNKVTARTMIAFSRNFDIPACDRLIVDFTGVSWCEPFGLLYLARILKRSTADVEFPVTAKSRDTNFRGYAEHMGFFRYIGFARGNHPGEASGSSRYLPIQRWDVDQFRRDAGALPFGEVVDIEAKRICQVMLQTNEGEAFDAVQYCLREILRNSIEHSRGDEVLFCAQYWPNSGKVEFAVLDDGIGLRRSLSDNGRLDMEDDADAVKMALLPGVSRVDQAGEPTNEVWDNSGFGLYVTSNLCASTGEFRLVSGKAGVMLGRNIERQPFASRFKGTGVQMKLEVPDGVGARTLLRAILKRGRRQATILQGRRRITPSVASQMLASDWDE